MVAMARDRAPGVHDDVGASIRRVRGKLAPLARGISNARLAAPGRSALAARNHAETRAWSMRSGRMFPNRGIRRPRRYVSKVLIEDGFQRLRRRSR